MTEAPQGDPHHPVELGFWRKYVFSLDHKVIGMPTLKEKGKVLDLPEAAFRVKCDVHPWMQAYVAVFSHPFFAVTGRDGTFQIKDLPAGTYDIEAWHEKLGTRKASVTVGAGDTKTLDFTLGLPKVQ